MLFGIRNIKSITGLSSSLQYKQIRDFALKRSLLGCCCWCYCLRRCLAQKRTPIIIIGSIKYDCNHIAYEQCSCSSTSSRCLISLLYYFSMFMISFLDRITVCFENRALQTYRHKMHVRFHKWAPSFDSQSLFRIDFEVTHRSWNVACCNEFTYRISLLPENRWVSKQNSARHSIKLSHHSHGYTVYYAHIIRVIFHGFK